MNDVSAAMLGMPGFRVLAVDDRGDADVQVMVETTAAVVGCPVCGVVARSKGRRTLWVLRGCRDLLAQAPLVLSRPGMRYEVLD